jgi:dTDP-3-amino-2,3,6-trideoxy-4-keto-D-glucose/dTDP-3-amino-3,4,6-trideoxy-alpha-D-glucose/dTDP-2,6-dideoxy-D-kanosamine transaminase
MMKVPFVDLPRQIAGYQTKIRAVIEDVVFTRADFIMRDDLIAFEKESAAAVGTQFAIGVANGSDALNLAIKALGIGPGDEVITVSHTFIATIAAIAHAGAAPVLIDVADDHVMDVSQLEAAITPRTKAIIPVHLNGRMCDMKSLMDIAQRHHLFVIEDSAQAIGATYMNKAAGSFGIMSTNSFYPFKIIGCFGDGGAITTSDSDLNYKLRCLRDNGQDRQKGDILFWGWNSRLDNLQAAILSVMLADLKSIVAKRREIAAQYTKGLHGIKGLSIPEAPTSSGSFFDSFQNYVVQTPRRDELIAHLSADGIGTLVSWRIPSHFHPKLGLTKFKLAKTEQLSREVVSLPMHPALSSIEVEHVANSVRTFFKKQ